VTPGAKTNCRNLPLNFDTKEEDHQCEIQMIYQEEKMVIGEIGNLGQYSQIEGY